MATFAFQMVAALSERSFGQGGVLMPQPFEVLSLNTSETSDPS